MLGCPALVQQWFHWQFARATLCFTRSLHGSTGGVTLVRAVAYWSLCPQPPLAPDPLPKPRARFPRAWGCSTYLGGLQPPLLQLPRKAAGREGAHVQAASHAGPQGHLRCQCSVPVVQHGTWGELPHPLAQLSEEVRAARSPCPGGKGLAMLARGPGCGAGCGEHTVQLLVH